MMPESRFISFPGSSVDPRVGISRSASETDFLLFFLSMTLKIIISYIVDILRRITTFSESHSVFFVVVQI